MVERSTGGRVRYIFNGLGNHAIYNRVRSLASLVEMNSRDIQDLERQK